MLKEVYEELELIRQKKEKELPTIDESTIDYAVLGEEIEDAKYAIVTFESHFNGDLDEIEFMGRLRSVLKSTTSSSIYDSVGKLFPKEYISDEQAKAMHAK